MTRAEEEKQAAATSAAISKAIPRIREVLPTSSMLQPEKIARMALMEVSASPYLRSCDAVSIARAVVQAAALGLNVGGLMGEAYLVPYKGKCTLIPGYKGLIKLAVQGLSMASAEARLVYTDDTFDVEYGTSPRVVHKPALTSTRRTDDDILYGYFVAKLRDGTPHFEVMTRAEVEKRRAASKAKDDGPWVTWYPEQFKKTVVRYGVKLVPASSDAEAYERLNAAVELDNRYDTGEILNANPLLDDQASLTAHVADRTRERTDELRAKLTAGREIPAATVQLEAEPVAVEPELSDAEIAKQDAMREQREQRPRAR